MNIYEVLAGNPREIERVDHNGYTLRLVVGPDMSFALVDAIAENWEMVEVEPIEVGDVVKWYEDSAEVTVAGMFQGEAACIYDNGAFIVKPIKNLTLIRKGAKVHTFEGVKWSIATLKDAPELKRSSPFVGEKNMEHFAQFEFDGKRFTMTLKEESDG